MLTDKDKCDLYRYISDRIRDAESDCTRHQLIVGCNKNLLRFIIEHPDVCAAEIDDFFKRSVDVTVQEMNRLHQKGML
ncbi:unnamed protein product [marine sediment metagenome]|uniref:Uncharacterized protein n=1 Tax=marine sediment metagenome TaxID=412755 RepID=X0WPR4_9ZZZZ